MRLRVLSYNIHKCIGGVDRRYEPSRIVEVIRKLDCDVLMLQEVDAGVSRSNGDRQVEPAVRAPREPHRAHAAAAEQAFHLVGTKLGTDRQLFGELERLLGGLERGPLEEVRRFRAAREQPFEHGP